MRFRHPFIERDSLGILADYVTNDTGTGCVHTAPGHGQEDYISGVKHGLPILSPVDARGVFTAEVEHFAGQRVFDANTKVVELLREKGALLATGFLQHSYPHCWRCKNPIIFRATEQWFIAMSHDDLRGRALKAIDSVEWVPPSGRNRIHSMIEGRPDWCISRQRLWGVPITILACDGCRTPVRDKRFFDSVLAEIAARGAGIWWGGRCVAVSPRGFRLPEVRRKIFHSGDGHSRRLVRLGSEPPGHSGPRRGSPVAVRDLPEGSDQHRGWFHTSLLTALMLEGAPPYKQVVTHGFVLDGEGRAMSKSLGNVIAPEEVVKKAGAEILRLWVSMVDYRDDVRLSWDLISRNSEAYRKIRNTIRYLLGNLYDFRPEDAVPLGTPAPSWTGTPSCSWTVSWSA